MNDKKQTVNLGIISTMYVVVRLNPVYISMKLDTVLSIDNGILVAMYITGMLLIGLVVLNSQGFDTSTLKTSPIISKKKKL